MTVWQFNSSIIYHLDSIAIVNDKSVNWVLFDCHRYRNVEKYFFFFKFSKSKINCLLSFTLIYPRLLLYSNCCFHYCNNSAILDSLIPNMLVFKISFTSVWHVFNCSNFFFWVREVREFGFVYLSFGNFNAGFDI